MITQSLLRTMMAAFRNNADVCTQSAAIGENTMKSKVPNRDVSSDLSFLWAVLRTRFMVTNPTPDMVFRDLNETLLPYIIEVQYEAFELGFKRAKERYDTKG
jgi:hypothetical protein